VEMMFGLLESFDLDSPNFPPTLIYNEGWMLRILLDWFSKNQNIEHTFKYHKSSKWFSEAQLPTPFHARYRRDNLAEKRTKADGIIGQFDIQSINMINNRIWLLLMIPQI